MLLRVPFERFPETAAAMATEKRAYLEPWGAGSLVTAASFEKSVIVAAETDQPPNEARKWLEQAGFEVGDGVWAEALSASNIATGHHYVSAVAYRSGEASPGLWMDAHDEPVTEAQVLRHMYDEFCDTGEVSDVSFDEFVRYAQPNVVILSPDEIAAFAKKQSGCE